MTGIIKHDPMNATHAAAAECKRQAVTARWLNERPNVQGYIYDPEADKNNLDPWRNITGIDGFTDDDTVLLLETGHAGQREIPADFEVFVSQKDAPASATAGDWSSHEGEDYLQILGPAPVLEEIVFIHYPTEQDRVNVAHIILLHNETNPAIVALLNSLASEPDTDDDDPELADTLQHHIDAARKIVKELGL